MTLLVRADASSIVGVGHILRTSRLAWELARYGAKVIYLSKNLPPPLALKLSQQGFKLHAITPKDQYEDLEITIAAALAHEASLILVDHYAWDAKMQQELRRQTLARLWVVDDLFLPHAADLIYNPNLYATPTLCQEANPQSYLLCGSAFALLDPIYQELHHTPTYPKRILLSLGGADPLGLTAMLIPELAPLLDEETICDVVVGPANPKKKEIEKIVASFGERHILHDAPSTLAPLLSRASLAIVGAGTTVMEALYFRLPLVAIEVATNQQLLASYLRQLKGVECFEATTPAATIAKVAIKLLSSHQRPLPPPIATHHPVEEITRDPLAHWRLRPALKRDLLPLLALANDPEVRAQSLNSSTITLEEHSRWFHQKLHDPKTRLYVADDLCGMLLGTVRFEQLLNEWRVSLALAPTVRGRHFSLKLLRKAIANLVNDVGRVTLVAEIKKSNLPSRALFKRAHFKQIGENDDLVFVKAVVDRSRDDYFF
ncbi:MAG: UDP-2,4-diacetamido-2,4,6-trideoxy-beta-L-altropyranose hydrolase [Campylobacterales bacterium]